MPAALRLNARRGLRAVKRAAARKRPYKTIEQLVREKRMHDALVAGTGFTVRNRKTKV